MRRWRACGHPTAPRAAAPAPQTAATLTADDGADVGGALAASTTPRAMAAAAAIGGSSRSGAGGGVAFAPWGG